MEIHRGLNRLTVRILVVLMDGKTPQLDEDNLRPRQVHRKTHRKVHIRGGSGRLRVK